MNHSQDALGGLVQKLRIDMGMSQRELARLAGFKAHQTISMIEQGSRAVRATELRALAAALLVDVEVLLGSAQESPAPDILWYSPTGRRARVRSRQKRVEVLFARRLADYRLVEQVCGLEPTHWLEDFEWNWKSPTLWQAEKLARQVAEALGTGSRPAFSLARLLEEEFLLSIWYEDIGAVGVAACTRGPHGDGILINALEAPWRRNFNVARELFHLLTWPGAPGAGGPEEEAPDPAAAALTARLANSFATALLLPHREFDQLLQRCKAGARLTFENLFTLARDFGVSAEAVLWRLEGLRRLTREQVEKLLRDSHLRAIDRQTVGNTWLRAPRLPERFVRLCFFAHRRRGIHSATLASLLGCAPEEVRPMLLSYGFDDREDYRVAVVE